VAVLAVLAILAMLLFLSSNSVTEFYALRHPSDPASQSMTRNISDLRVSSMLDRSQSALGLARLLDLDMPARRMRNRSHLIASERLHEVIENLFRSSEEE
jgi:hypothetical protein